MSSSARTVSQLVRAVVVGISSYDGTGLPDLPACSPEAGEVAKALCAESGCAVPRNQVSYIPDALANAKAISEALEAAVDAGTSDEIIVFYFAGHGESLPGGFLLRTRSLSGDSEGLTAAALQKILARTKARGVLLILDCCGGAALAENAPSLFRRLGEAEFRILVSASRSGQSSWESQDRGSIFTQHLLRALRGEERLGARGEVYFSDLYGYLHAGVSGDRRLPQEPVFTGVYGADPLLFLNRELTLEQVRVRLRRLTPETVRFRVRSTVVIVAMIVSLSLGGYWVLLDNHQFLETRGDVVSLVHGYPGLSGFGLPEDRWTYALSPGSFKQGAFDGTNRSSPKPAGTPPDEIVLALLSPSAEARMRMWLGEPDRARKLLLEESRTTLASESSDLIPQIVHSGDEAWLEPLILESEAGVAEIYLRALLAIDGERAATVLMRSKLVNSIGQQLNLISDWRGSCGPQTQSWFERFVSVEGTRRFLSAASLMALRTGCRLSVASALMVDARNIQSAAYTIRITNPDGWRDLQGIIADALASVQTGRSQPPPDVLSRLASFAHYLGQSVCTPALLDAIPSEDPSARISAAIAEARDCQETSLEIVIASDAVALALHRRNADLPVASLTLAPDLGAEAVSFMDALMETGAHGLEPALRAILRGSGNADVRSAAVKYLNRAGFEGRDALDFNIDGGSALKRDLVKWLARSDAISAARALQENGPSGDLTSLSAAAFVPMNDEQLRAFLASIRGRDTATRRSLEALILPTDEAASLLVDPDPAARNAAREFVLGRSDWREVVDLAARLTRFADPTIQDVRTRGKRLAVWTEEAKRTPQWARAWWGQWMENLEPTDSGLALAFERVLDGLAIEGVDKSTPKPADEAEPP